MARRLCGMGKRKYANGFAVTLHEDLLEEPYKWKRPSSIFACSMSDLFHKSVPFSFVDKVMDTVRNTGRHRYQIITKRASRLREYFLNNPVPENLWLGVTVEVAEEKRRLDCLRDINASVRFLCCEPLLEDLGEIDLNGVDWIIVGGESGVRARAMNPKWVWNIKRQADIKNTPFFFKQWGTWGEDGVRRNTKSNGKTLGGYEAKAYPKAKG
jgi:protein gp37